MSLVKAGGAIFASLKTKKICLFLRSKEVSNPHTWGFIGGKIHTNEKILKGVSREIKEEMGFIPKYKKILPIDVYKSGDGKFMYYSYIILVDAEFLPELNHENSGWGWFDINDLPKPLHSGAKIILLNSQFKKVFEEIITDNR